MFIDEMFCKYFEKYQIVSVDIELREWFYCRASKNNLWTNDTSEM